MDVLRNFFGNLTAGIIRLAVVVGILAALYLFAIRPVLDTTEDITNRAFDQQSQVQNSIQQSIQRSINQTNRQIQRQFGHPPPPAAVPTRTQITRTVRNLTPGQARRLNRCVQRAAGRLPAFNRCFDRFSRR